MVDIRSIPIFTRQGGAGASKRYFGMLSTAPLARPACVCRALPQRS